MLEQGVNSKQHLYSNEGVIGYMCPMSLPSKYAPEGISLHDQHKVITVGEKPTKRPANYHVRLIEDRIEEAVRSSGAHGETHDIEMVPTDDFDEVDIISQFVSESRNHLSHEGPVLEIDECSNDAFQKTGNVSYLIVDTNFMLSHLNIVEDLKAVASDYGLMIIVPVTVMKELDGLKSSNRKDVSSSTRQRSSDALSTESVSHLARWANEWIYSVLAENSPVVKGQRLDQRIDNTATQDDSILDCCLYFKHEYPNTLQVLLSNDKNFCLKALSNEILTVSYRKEMSAEIIAKTIHKENISRFGKLSDDTSSLRPAKKPDNVNGPALSAPSEVRTTVYREIQTIALSVVHHCMESEYGDCIDLVQDYSRDSIVTLSDCADTIIKFWIPVFSHYFRGKMNPFEEVSRGSGKPRKVPVWVDVPSKSELGRFVEYWVKVLTILYEAEMSEDQNLALKALVQRWQSVIKASC